MVDIMRSELTKALRCSTVAFLKTGTSLKARDYLLKLHSVTNRRKYF
jgi:hypothetical protein